VFLREVVTNEPEAATAGVKVTTDESKGVTGMPEVATGEAEVVTDGPEAATAGTNVTTDEPEGVTGTPGVTTGGLGLVLNEKN
jgi:hypothetical protein